MKAAHRKTIWVHTVFAVLMAGILAILLAVTRNVAAAVIAVFIALYIGGHVIIHLRRDDLKAETVVEYTLLGAAVFIVLISAVR